MRFWSIWSMPSYPLRERLYRTRDWAALTATHFVPLRLRFWIVMRELGKATATSANVPATPLDEILRNLDRPKYVA